MSRYHIVLDRVAIATGFLDSGDSVSHFTPEALKQSIGLKLVELWDISSDEDTRIVRHIKGARIAKLRDEVRLDLRALRKKDYDLYETCLGSYYEALRRL